ncbi:Protein still life, isoform SIF type 1 [Atta colombica]|uniref:Protein still life, isoform SIF type 1 n=1 Tax=Atta colombica TaxID=520822 RepID=A0A195BTG6_9HYME|nr:Protein still life, isoform SIF type 1 [Atta colombica]
MCRVYRVWLVVEEQTAQKKATSNHRPWSASWKSVPKVDRGKPAPRKCVKEEPKGVKLRDREREKYIDAARRIRSDILRNGEDRTGGYVLRRVEPETRTGITRVVVTQAERCCAPLIRSKTYRYEDSPWQAGARGGMGGGGGRRGDTGHLLRLWAEVFHVNSSGGGSKWQQVSEDLVPVNITCIQDSPECVFHITAYNSQVDKILDVRLVQPGTRIGQASECFVYWKDTVTNDTWGLNFTSPIDAKQFRECCSPSFKISRKASSSYSLKLEPPNKQKIKTRRKPLSTPASPSRSREPQCTCMTPEQYARLRSQDTRYRSPCGPSTLPRTIGRSTEMDMTPGRDKITAATSSASLYDNVNNTSATPGKTPKAGDSAKQKEKQNETCQTTPKTANIGIGTVTIDSPDEKGSTISPKKQKQSQDTSTQQNGIEMLKSEGTQAGGTLQIKSLRKEQLHHTKSADYTELEMQNGNLFNIVNNNHGHRSKSKSTDDMRIENAQNGGISLDSNTLKRMLKPMPSIDSPVTSPEMTRKRHSHHSYHYHPSNNNQKYMMQEIDNENYAHPYRAPYNNKFQSSRSAHDMSRQYSGTISSCHRRTSHHVRRTSCTLGCTSLPAGGRGRTYLDSERNRCTGDMSPPSDNVIFDNQCYATTPSSSNGNSDMEQPNHCNSRRCNGGQTYQQSMQSVSTPGSPTSRLLLEYEMHLRNTLAKGMDAESYSLRTFEALLTQSMENLEFAENIPLNVQRTPHASRRRSNSNKSSTLPLSYRYCNERQNSKDRDGYYSDRNEMVREKRERDPDRDRGYLSDYNSRSLERRRESKKMPKKMPKLPEKVFYRILDNGSGDQSRNKKHVKFQLLGEEDDDTKTGVLCSDFSPVPARCASCIGESARAQWFRHSDGWQSGSSTFGSGASSSINPGYSGHKRESPWDSLPSLRHEGSLNDSGYKSNRTDSLEQRGTFDRQDSVRSDYMSDRDGRYGIVQQASLESTDSRLCYLTSSEVAPRLAGRARVNKNRAPLHRCTSRVAACANSSRTSERPRGERDAGTTQLLLPPPRLAPATGTRLESAAPADAPMRGRRKSPSRARYTSPDTSAAAPTTLDSPLENAMRTRVLV